MGEFDWNNAATRRMGYGTAPPSIDIMDALGRHTQTENGLVDPLQSPAQNMSLFSRTPHSSVFDTQGSDPTLSQGLTGSLPSSSSIDYAAMEDIIRQRVAHQIGQVTQQARLQSQAHSVPTPFDQQQAQRTQAMRSLENEEGRMSARLASLTGARDLNASQLSSLARGIPGLPVGYPDAMGGLGQPNRRLQLPGIYDNGLGLMDLVNRPGMMQEEEILRGLRDSQHLSNMPLSALMNQERDASFQGHSQLMNAPPHSRLSCRTCGRWNFSNHIELIEHESTCPANINPYDGSTMMPRQRLPTNDALGVDQSLVQALGHDRAANSMRRPPSISTVEEIVRKLTNGSSSMPMESGASISNESQEGASFQLSKSIPLAMPTDKDWITPLHCFVRRYCVELFTASTSDIFHRSSKGKRRPIHAGRIGIRCPHCHKVEDNSAGNNNRNGLNKGSVYFPTTIASIYNATMNLLQRHMHVCENVPQEIMKRYNDLKADDARSGTSKKYWIESAKALGLVDTVHGIQFSNNSSLSMQTFNYPAEIFSTDTGVNPHSPSPNSNLLMQKSGSSPSMVGGENTLFSDIEGGPLVAPEYKYLATAYSYALLSQMQACVFTEADRLGKRKGLPLGFAGLACRHCYGGYGSGRFFPSNIKTMSDTSKTLNVLHSHMMRCRKCPSRVKVGLQTLRLGHDEERSKMKFGSQKAFFVNIWKRLHGERPLDGRKVSHKKRQSMTEALESEEEKEKKSPEVTSDVTTSDVTSGIITPVLAQSD